MKFDEDRKQIKFKAYDKSKKCVICWSEIKYWISRGGNKFVRDLFLLKNEDLVLLDFTGFTDVNKEEIYIADILNFKPIHDPVYAVGVVTWCSPYGCFGVTEYFSYPKSYRSYRFNEIWQYEVIGNFYEHSQYINSAPMRAGEK